MNISHPEMVKTLVKNGDLIVSELTGSKANLWHMASALTGEALELLEAYDVSFELGTDLDIENCVEELGDSEFYIEGLRAELGLTREETIATSLDRAAILSEVCQGEPSIAALKFALATNRLFDLIKKIVIYNKTLVQGAATNPKEEVSLLDIKQRLIELESILLTYRNLSGIEYQQSLNHNIEKLRKRYEGFVYTDQAAMNRADKDAEDNTDSKEN